VLPSAQAQLGGSVPGHLESDLAVDREPGLQVRHPLGDGLVPALGHPVRVAVAVSQGQIAHGRGLLGRGELDVDDDPDAAGVEDLAVGPAHE